MTSWQGAGAVEVDVQTSHTAADAARRTRWDESNPAQPHRLDLRARPAECCGASGCPQHSPLLTIRDVAARLQVSPRWLADQCRAGTIEHIHLARQRRFTPEHVTALLTKFTHRPAADIARDDFRAKVMRRLARSQHDKQTRARST